jgi:hypothetical protein
MELAINIDFRYVGTVRVRYVYDVRCGSKTTNRQREHNAFWAYGIMI